MLRNKTKGFISIEYIIVAAVVIFAFTAFAMSFAAGNQQRYGTVQNQLTDNGAIITNGTLPGYTNPSCFTMGSLGVIAGYDASCGTKVIIPSKIDGETITEIGNSAFMGRGITQLSLPDTLLKIGDSAFKNNSLTAVIIPKSVIEIDDYAFSNNSIVNLYIPSTLTSMGKQAFNSNNLPQSSAFIYAYSTSGIDRTRIVSYGGALKAVTVPYGVTTIDQYAFFSTGLQSVVIPSTVNSIGDYAFGENSLTSGRFEGVLPTTLGTNIFSQNAGLTASTIKVPSAQLAAYQSRAISNFGLSNANVFYQ